MASLSLPRVSPGRRSLLVLAVLATVATLFSALPCAAEQDSCPPEDACRSSPDAPLCSGRGQCDCGVCNCYRQDITGQFCECDNGSCSRSNGLLCGGPGHGRCSCGRCACQPGWQGEACDCVTSTVTCKQPGSDRVCSGKGSCECGRCRCYEHSNERYSGEFCETCPTCVGKCETYRNCAECLAFKTGPLANHCQTACSQVSVQMEDKLTVSGPRERLCSFYTDEGCRFQFVIGTGGRLRVQRLLQCPPTEAPYTPAATAASGGSGASGVTISGSGVLAAALAAAIWRR